ncbi:MAG TPA: flagellar hook-basal body complex protein FliE [Thiotrichales bacterium]|nr:flagellar hook-basal body complex protein FliE [Thiotrichales bacterium]
MSDIEISQVLAQMRALAARAQAGVEGAATPGQVERGEGPGFADLLKKSLDAVNETQKEAGALARAFEKGDPNVDLPQVMVALQKASVSFQAMTQVRNKLVDAYQEIMRMQG